MIDELECYDPKEPEILVKIITVDDALGFFCVSPSDHAKIGNHHDALHTELNRKNKK
jgi:hypothetical protein